MKLARTLADVLGPILDRDDAEAKKSSFLLDTVPGAVTQTGGASSPDKKQSKETSKMKTTKTPTIKAQAHGLKIGGKFYKCSVSFGNMRDHSKTFTIYGTGYYCSLPQVAGWECNTDSQTDYFEHDKIRVTKGTPLYRAWVGELRRKRNIDRARFRAQQNKRQVKWAAQRGETFTPKNAFAVWLEKNAHYQGLIEAKAQREAAARQAVEIEQAANHNAWAAAAEKWLQAQAAEQAAQAAATYRAMLPPVLTVLPRIAPAPKCAPVAFAWSRVAPTCRPAAWRFVGR